MTQIKTVTDRRRTTYGASTSVATNGFVTRDGRQLRRERRYILDLDDFSRDEIEEVLRNTDAMAEVLNRDIKKVPALRGKTVMTLFYEASTRTRVSFEQAGKILSADVINVSVGDSSVEKGESLYNTALTLQAMKADIIVVRHGHSGHDTMC